ncbi:hypothetical protein Q787_06285 [Ornithobacterium rhinotracheale H06-030791]|nr:hypothetical protein Q785_06470 [Ornithobacterium rhinotracheale ORT-UMN 88]KGB66644.1 hypothetical protein Q787_06285 [Ornithobacterium rhinotracheale H06-030791]
MLRKATFSYYSILSLKILIFRDIQILFLLKNKLHLKLFTNKKFSSMKLKRKMLTL